jgi:hypothetical protein
LSQFRKCSLDPREYRSLSELGEYPLCLGQMLKRERTPFLGFIQQSEDHLRTTYMKPSSIKMRVGQNARWSDGQVDPRPVRDSLREDIPRLVEGIVVSFWFDNRKNARGGGAVPPSYR